MNCGAQEALVAGEDMFASYLMRLVRESPPNVRFEYFDHLIEGLGQIKSSYEIELVRKRVRVQ